MTHEEWHAYIAAHLPEPVVVEHGAGGETWFTGGDPGEVLVRLRPRSIAVFEFAIQFDGRSAEIAPRLVGSFRPAGVPDGRAMEIVSSLVEAARQLRLGRFGACRVCGERHPPESMADGVCRECTGGRLDLVH